MAKFFSFSLFILSLLCARSQNLVPNPSFEEFENGCPEDFHEMPLGWTWWLGSPNSFSTCVNPVTLEDSLGWAPLNGFGYQWPASGDAYIGLYGFGNNFNPNYREFIGIQLSEPLQVDQTYFISFKTSLALDGFYYEMMLACSHLGVFFTMQEYNWLDDPLEIPNSSHVFEPSIITDTADWVTISGSFIADQPYSHMGIGVFFDSDLVDTLQVFGENNSYYFIDDVCVAQNPDCAIVGGVESVQEDFHIFPNPSSSFCMLHGMEGMATVDVFNLSGQRILTFESVSEGEAIDISELNEGMYILELKVGNSIEREKLIKCHGRN